MSTSGIAATEMPRAGRRSRTCGAAQRVDERTREQAARKAAEAQSQRLRYRRQWPDRCARGSTTGSRPRQPIADAGEGQPTPARGTERVASGPRKRERTPSAAAGTIDPTVRAWLARCSASILARDSGCTRRLRPRIGELNQVRSERSMVLRRRAPFEKVNELVPEGGPPSRPPGTPRASPSA